MSDRPAAKKIRTLHLWGLIGIVIGFGLDPVTPIVKRICTSSFVIVSGGFCFVSLTLSFWLIDVRGYRRWLGFAIVFGMNPLFIYLFAHLGGDGWLTDVVSPFTQGFLYWGGKVFVEFATAAIVLWMDWYLVHWLAERKILIRI